MVEVEKLVGVFIRELLPLVSYVDWGRTDRVEKAKKLLEELREEYPGLEVGGVLSQLEGVKDKPRRGDVTAKLEEAVKLLEEAEAGLPPLERERLALLKAQVSELKQKQGQGRAGP